METVMECSLKDGGRLTLERYPTGGAVLTRCDKDGAVVAFRNYRSERGEARRDFERNRAAFAA